MPRGALTGRAPTALIGSSSGSGIVSGRLLPQAGHDEVAEPALADRGDGHDPVALQVRVIGPGALSADVDLDRVSADRLLGVTRDPTGRFARRAGPS